MVKVNYPSFDMDLDVVQYQLVNSICDTSIARPWSCLIGFLRDEELVFSFHYTTADDIKR